MSENNDTLAGGGAPAPANEPQQPQQPAQPAPKSDAEAAQREEADRAKQPPEPKQPPDERKKNRTREYIERINGENRDLRNRLQAVEARLPKEPAPHEKPRPKLEDFAFDQDKHAEAVARWVNEQDRHAQGQRQSADDQQKQVEQTITTYKQRVDDFADEHDDFFELVEAIPYAIGPEIQLAIMAHEKGPSISYYIANNDDEAFTMANVLPQNAEAAVKRLVARMDKAAPQDPNTTPPGNGAGEPEKGNGQQPPVGSGAPAAQKTPAKQISQAPQPAATVGGRSSVETPAEKLTDDEWFAREKERTRKR